MRTGFLRSGALVGMLLGLSGGQLAMAQGVREPTVDERYRDPNTKAADAEMPRLIAPQSKLKQEKSTAGKSNAAAYLGVTFAGDDEEALVRTVAPGSPAEQAGLQANDLIETLQGRRIRNNQEVLDIVAKMRPGDVLEIGFTRRMSIRTQAPLANVPTATPRSVGYPPDLPASIEAAPADPQVEPMPAPTNGQRDAAGATAPPNRNTPSQSKSGSAAAQRGNDDKDKKSNQSNENRRLFGRGLRLR